MKFSIILPTYNESENICGIIDSINRLEIPDLEIIVVDDSSPDGTFETASTHAEKYANVRVLKNPDSRGLSVSVAHGFDNSDADIICCMDADGQHRTEDLPGILKTLTDIPGNDMTAGSRYLPGGGFEQKWNTFRNITSHTAAMLARLVLRIKISDPMSGFFAVRKSAYDRVRPYLHPSGFKIMLEILYLLNTAGEPGFTEYPIIFKKREHGKSKLSFKVCVSYIWMLCSLFIRRRELKEALTRSAGSNPSQA